MYKMYGILYNVQCTYNVQKNSLEHLTICALYEADISGLFKNVDALLCKYTNNRTWLNPWMF
jgi:hypothetical protein